MMEEMKKRLTDFLSADKRRVNLIVLLCAAAVLLIILPGTDCAVRDEKTATQSDPAESYARSLEEKLEKTIREIEGAGETRVLITLQGGREYIYAREDQTSSDLSESVDPSGRQSSDESQNRQSNLIIIDTDQGEQALVCTELMPAVNGVVVVCAGAGDPAVKERIMAVVTTALNISSKRVCITQLSQ